MDVGLAKLCPRVQLERLSGMRDKLSDLGEPHEDERCSLFSDWLYWEIDGSFDKSRLDPVFPRGCVKHLES